MLQLKPHQKKVFKHIRKQNGLILYHSTGSGKTITSLVSMHQFNKLIIIIGPKSSRKAFVDEITKLKYDQKYIQFFTFTKIIKILAVEENFVVNTCVIIDEAHHVRNISKNHRFLWSSLHRAFKILLLTATPFINHVCDLFVLINIINKNKDLPVYRTAYEKRLKNKTIDLESSAKNIISYYKADQDKFYPSSKKQIMKVYYTKEQTKEYEKYIRKILYDEDINGDPKVSDEDMDLGSKWIKKYNIKNQVYELDETIRENSFLAATRQLANTINGLPNYPKIKNIFETIQQNKYPCIVYSSYLKNGLYAIKQSLDLNNISCDLITGNSTDIEIVNSVSKYNKGITQVLLLSSAATESLDLKSTRQIHVMEPFWNKSRIYQVIGRAIRFKSHYSLDLKDQNVKIFEWISVFKDDQYKGLSADEYLVRISDYKEKEYKKYDKILIHLSI
jgi:superfamily II DNA or RNA helicase